MKNRTNILILLGYAALTQPTFSEAMEGISDEYLAEENALLKADVAYKNYLDGKEPAHNLNA